MKRNTIFVVILFLGFSFSYELFAAQIPPQRPGWQKLDLPHPLYDGPVLNSRRLSISCFNADIWEGLNVWTATDVGSGGQWWTYAGKNTTDSPIDDGKSTGGIVFDLSRNTLGQTINQDGGIIGQTFTERDMVLNGNWFWTTHTCGETDNPFFGSIDVTSIVAHEMGHLLSLDHVDMFGLYTCTSDTNIDPQEPHTMEDTIPQTSSTFCYRTLHAHDKAGANQIYPLLGPDPAEIADLIVEVGPFAPFESTGEFDEWRTLPVERVVKGESISVVTIVLEKGGHLFNLQIPGPKRLYLKKRDDGTYRVFYAEGLDAPPPITLEEILRDPNIVP